MYIFGPGMHERCPASKNSQPNHAAGAGPDGCRHSPDSQRTFTRVLERLESTSLTPMVEPSRRCPAKGHDSTLRLAMAGPAAQGGAAHAWSAASRFGGVAWVLVRGWSCSAESPNNLPSPRRAQGGRSINTLTSLFRPTRSALSPTGRRSNSQAACSRRGDARAKLRCDFGPLSTFRHASAAPSAGLSPQCWAANRGRVV